MVVVVIEKKETVKKKIKKMWYFNKMWCKIDNWCEVFWKVILEKYGQIKLILYDE